MKKYILALVICLASLFAPALATDITIQSSTLPNFYAKNLGSIVSGTASVTNGSTTISSSARFPSKLVGVSGYKIVLNGVQYEVANTVSTSHIELTSGYDAGISADVSFAIYPVVFLNITVNKPFQPNGSPYIIQSAAQGPGIFYKRVGCSVIDNQLYIPDIVLPATTDVAGSDNYARYTAVFYSSDGAKIANYGGFESFLVSHTNPTTTWTAVRTYNIPAISQRFDDGSLSRDQILELLNNLAGGNISVSNANKVLVSDSLGFISSSTIDSSVLSSIPSKYDKTGGTISGNVGITGNLSVTGTATGPTATTGTNTTQLATTAFVQQEVPSATISTAGKSQLGKRAVYTVSTLPTCNSSIVSTTVNVSDGNKGQRTCRNTTGSVYAWVDDEGGVFNVRRFGATGDGTTDDAAAINEAVAAAPYGSTILFPPNTDGTVAAYKIGTSIKIRKGLKYKGSGSSPISSDASYRNSYIKPSGAIWTFERYASDSTVILGVSFEDLSISFASDTSVLGVWNWDGISWSSITNVGVEPADSSSVRRYIVKLTGGSLGAYYNNFNNVNVYRGGMVTAFYFTSAANENKVYGGGCQDCDKPVILDNTNGVSFFGYSSDGGQNITYSFLNGSSNNRIISGRSEHYPIAGVSFSRSANVVTVTHSGAKFFAVGEWVYAYNCGDSSFNNPYTPVQIASVPDSTHFTYAQAAANSTTTGSIYFGSVAYFSATSTGNVVSWLNNAEDAKFSVDDSGTGNTIYNTGRDYENKLQTADGSSGSTAIPGRDLLRAATENRDNTFTGQNVFADVTSGNGTVFKGYSFNTGNSTANGELLLGNYPTFRGRFSYDGASAAKLFIDNTYNGAGTGIVLRTRTSGTPETNAQFVDGVTWVSQLRLGLSAGASDVGVGRYSAGVAEINNGTPGTSTGDLRLRNIISSGTLEQTTNSATAVAIGRQGATSPAFKIDASAASSATGVQITAAAAGSGVALAAISSGSNESLQLSSKGTGLVLVGDTTTATATAGAATANTQKGTITSEALTTASGSDYVLTLTNSKITASSVIMATADNGTNTTEGLAINRVTPGSGSVVIRVRNTHASSAWNGTIKINFVVF